MKPLFTKEELIDRQKLGYSIPSLDSDCLAIIPDDEIIPVKVILKNEITNELKTFETERASYDFIEEVEDPNNWFQIE